MWHVQAYKSLLVLSKILLHTAFAPADIKVEWVKIGRILYSRKQNDLRLMMMGHEYRCICRCPLELWMQANINIFSKNASKIWLRSDSHLGKPDYWSKLRNSVLIALKLWRCSSYQDLLGTCCCIIFSHSARRVVCCEVHLMGWEMSRSPSNCSHSLMVLLMMPSCNSTYVASAFRVNKLRNDFLMALCDGPCWKAKLFGPRIFLPDGCIYRWN